MNRQVSLAEATELLTDGTHYTPPNIGAGIPFLTVKDVTEEGLDFNGSSKISIEEFERAKAQNSAPQVGDVLFSKDGTVGKVHLVTVDRPFAVLSSLAILRPGKHLDSAYLAHFLRTPAAVAAAERRKTGSAIRRIVLRDLASLTVPLPPLEDQRRIAAILDKADALRQKRKRAIALLDSLTQSIFLEMFGDASTLTKVALSKLGKVHTGKTPPTSNAELFVGTIPFVTPGDLEVDRPPSRFLSTDGASYSKLVPAGSTLVCCIGATIGKMGIARTPVSFNQQINAIEWSNEIIPLYGLQAMRQVRHEVIGRSISTTLPILKKSEFEKIEIIVADRDRQATFALKVEKLNLIASTHKRELTVLDTLFSSLQQRAFSGQL